jgi:hypothetical protein
MAPRNDAADSVITGHALVRSLDRERLLDGRHPAADIVVQPSDGLFSPFEAIGDARTGWSQTWRLSEKVGLRLRLQNAEWN